MLVATVFFSNSCGKKSSDPAPAETPTTPTANVKEVPRDIKTKEPASEGDGTVRTSPTSVITNGTTVAVQAPTSNFKTTGLSADGKTNLNNLLGVTNARMAGAFDFGWYVIKVDAQLDPNSVEKTDLLGDANPNPDSLETILFFDDENPGIYYQYYYALDKNQTGDLKFWDWGTYAVDKEVKTIAFDFDSKNVPESIWNIKFMTSSSMVLKTDIEGDSGVVPVTVGLYGFNLQSGNDTHDASTLETNLAPSPSNPVSWYLDSYNFPQQTTPDYYCQIASPISFYPSISYMYGSPIPCSESQLGYYYFKKSSTNKEVLVMYFDIFIDNSSLNPITYTDFFVEAEVTLTDGVLSLMYTSCPLIPSIVNSTSKYTTTVPTAPVSTAVRKE